MLDVALKKSRGEFHLDAAFKMTAPGIVALFGPSGCGKSTLIQLMAGLMRPDAGMISLNGQSLFDAKIGLDVVPERRGIGCVFQGARLFPHLDVAANLRYGSSRSTRRSYIAFDDVVELLQLRSLLQRRPASLSGGEKQRVAIGRALLSQPNLLLLDEPLASLDAARREDVLPYLEMMRDRLAIPMVFVTHQFEEVLRLATQVVLMQSGKIIAQGPLEQISLGDELRALIGIESVGAVVSGEIVSIDADSGLASLKIGCGQLKVPALTGIPGNKVRIQLLARDIIVATQPPLHLSVRNLLTGTISGICAQTSESDLISIDIGGTQTILARITTTATRELNLAIGINVWALVKSVSIQGHSFSAPMPQQRFKDV